MPPVLRKRQAPAPPPPPPPPPKRQRTTRTPPGTRVFRHGRSRPDVSIYIFGDHYHLHGVVLRDKLGWFKTGMSKKVWDATKSHPGQIKYRYMLQCDRFWIGDPDDSLELEQDYDTEHRLEPYGPLDRPERPNPAHFKHQSQIRKVYKSIFESCYYDFTVPEYAMSMRHFEKYLQRFEEMFETAKQYEYTPPIIMGINGFLQHWIGCCTESVRFNGFVEDNCIRFLQLAINFQYRELYKDAWIYTVGQYSKHERQIERFEMKIRLSIWKEVARLERIRKWVQRAFFAIVEQENDDSKPTIDNVCDEEMLRDYEPDLLEIPRCAEHEAYLIMRVHVLSLFSAGELDEDEDYRYEERPDVEIEDEEETRDSETRDSETADSETAGLETVDSETEDSETADSETLASETSDEDPYRHLQDQSPDFVDKGKFLLRNINLLLQNNLKLMKYEEEPWKQGLVCANFERANDEPRYPWEETEEIAIDSD